MFNLLLSIFNIFGFLKIVIPIVIVVIIIYFIAGLFGVSPGYVYDIIINGFKGMGQFFKDLF